MYETILVPTDGSDHAERAAERGFGLAAALGARVHVVSVVDSGLLGDVRLPGDATSAERAFGRKAKEFVERLAAVAEEHGLDVTTAIPEGPTEEEILRYADEHGVDLIVMGTHGRSGLNRLALGSVTEHVIRYGDIEVLVVGGGVGDERE